MSIQGESSFARKTNNAIRSLIESPRIQKLIKATHDEEKPMIPLSIGDPTVFKNLKTPQVFVDAVCEAVRDFSNHGYFAAHGSAKARQAVADSYSYPGNKISADDVVITSGCSHGLELLFKALLSQKGNKDCKKILLPNPGFPLYKSLADTYDLDIEFYNLREDKNWEVDLEDLRMKASADDVKAILINNPSNPCGAVFRKDHILEIIKVADETNTILVADEIYGDITFGANKFFPAASLSQMTTSVPIIALGGVAKEFLAPGLRLGWICFYDRREMLTPVVSGAQKLSGLIMGATSVLQVALPSVLNQSEEISKHKKSTAEQLGRNGSYLYERINAIRNSQGEQVFLMQEPQGSMYAFVKILGLPSKDLTMEAKKAKLQESPFEDVVHFFELLLQKEQLFVLPGSVFGSNGSNSMRITITPPIEILKTACDRLENFAQGFM